MKMKMEDMANKLEKMADKELPPRTNLHSYIFSLKSQSRSRSTRSNLAG